MVTKKNKKLTEELVKVQMQHIDPTFLQDEFTQMQVAICEIIEKLQETNLDEATINVIYQLNEICNAVIDKINWNISAQDFF